jgi:hypothetical protein
MQGSVELPGLFLLRASSATEDATEMADSYFTNLTHWVLPPKRLHCVQTRMDIGDDGECFRGAAQE